MSRAVPWYRESAPAILAGSDELASVLERWIRSANGLDPDRRAAAYLAADRVAVWTWRPFGLDQIGQKRARQQLEALGAYSDSTTRAGGYQYAMTWLDEASGHRESCGGSKRGST